MLQEHGSRIDSIEALARKLGGIEDDPERIAALRRSALVEGSAEEAFGRLTRLAAKMLTASVAVIMFFDDDHLFFRSAADVPAVWTSPHSRSLSRSFCRHIVSLGDALRIENVSGYPRLRDHPAVAELGIGACLGVPLLLSNGQPYGMLCVIDHEPREWTAAQFATVRDLAALTRTEVELRLELAARSRIQEELKGMRDAAERESGAKSEFLAMMSHEFRTPLNAVMAYTELMLAGIPERVPEPSREQLKRIRTSTRHLQQLVEEVLAFSRLDAEREQVHLERVNLQDLMQAVADLIRPLAAGKQLGLRIRAPTQPIEVRTDPGKLRQILLNLLGNAVKYTDEGEIGLTAERDPNYVILRVEDTGVGMTSAEADRVFEPFWQVYHGDTDGFGLGLSITEALVRLLNGEIDVRSSRGHGSTFTIRLPRGELAVAKKTA